VDLLKGRKFDDDAELHSAIYPIIKTNNISAKVFFQEVYGILIDKTSGPRLASFLLAIGQERAAKLLEKSL